MDHVASLTIFQEEGEEEGEEEQQQQQQQQEGVEIGEEEQQQQQHLLGSTASTLLIRQLPTKGLSFQLWPAASTLVSLLDQHQQPTNPLLPLLSRPRPHILRILELGSGTGLVGIAAAAALGAHTTLTDLPHVLPNLQFNVDANALAASLCGGSLHVHCLRWGEADDMAFLGQYDFDLILASDIVYHDHLFDPLLQTLSFFLRGNVVFVMAHLRRWKKKDSIFFRKARKLFDVRLIHSDPPSPGFRIGVAVYIFAEKGCRRDIIDQLLSAP